MLLFICVKRLQSRSWNFYKGISLYKRKDSPQFYGRLIINGKHYRKYLDTENFNEGEELLFQWKIELPLYLMVA